MTTTTVLGAIVTEAAILEEQGGQGGPDITMHRPAGTPLRNDGVFRYWMAGGETYRLAHDGIGWRVTCPTWRSGHVYRLADADAQFVDALPTTGGVRVLEEGRAYELREQTPFGVWELHLI